MYIISGQYKRRRLQFSGKIRPTQARVKESVFNVLGDITRKRVLDLCCGTGQNGLEALSRGALEAMFVDIDVRCVISNVNHLIDKGPSQNFLFARSRLDCFLLYLFLQELMQPYYRQYRQLHQIQQSK